MRRIATGFGGGGSRPAIPVCDRRDPEINEKV